MMIMDVDSSGLYLQYQVGWLGYGGHLPLSLHLLYDLVEFL